MLFVCLWFAIEPFNRWRLTALAVLLMAYLWVAPGYWTAVKIPRARRCNNEWAPAAVFAQGLEKRGWIVGAHSSGAAMRALGSFLIDRPVPERRLRATFQTREAFWNGGDPDPPGFRVEQSAEGYKLLVRTEESR